MQRFEQMRRPQKALGAFDEFSKRAMPYSPAFTALDSERLPFALQRFRAPLPIDSKDRGPRFPQELFDDNTWR